MMTTILKAMQKKNSGISEDVLHIFEDIVQNHNGPSSPYIGLDERCSVFAKAMEEHLTKEQRYRIFEKNGACNGASADKERKAFSLDYAHLVLNERIALFSKTFDRWKPVLNDDNTLTLTFKCTHGYYKCALEGTLTTPPPNVEVYFERCAGGRLYELQKALGIKLKIKSVDVSSLYEDVLNPVVFVFEIVE